MNKFFLAILVLFSFACSTNKENGESTTVFSLIDSLTIHTNLAYNTSHIGIVQYSDSLFYYVANVISQKRIDFFDERGAYQKSISLENAVKTLDEIADLQVVSLDTVLLISKYGNKVCFLNRKGEMWKKIDLNKWMPADSVYKYRLSAPSFGDFFVKNQLVLRSLKEVRKGFSSQNSYLDMIAEQWKSPVIFKFGNIYTDSIEFNEGLKLYPRIYPKDSLNLTYEFAAHQIVEPLLITTSTYSDKLYVFNFNNMELEKEITLNNDVEKFSKFNIPVNDTTIDPFIEKNEIRKKTGQYSGVGYNKFLEHYYIYFSKKLSNDFDFNNPEFHAVMLVYDKDFNKIKEVEIDGSKYRGITIPTENGFYKQTKKSYDNMGIESIVLHEFRY